jgi:hypothetical protein
MSPYAHQRSKPTFAEWSKQVSSREFGFWPRVPAPVASHGPEISGKLGPAQTS